MGLTGRLDPWASGYEPRALERKLGNRKREKSFISCVILLFVLKKTTSHNPAGPLTCDIDILILSSDSQVDPPSLLCMVLATETGNTGLTSSMDVHVTTSQMHIHKNDKMFA